MSAVFLCACAELDPQPDEPVDIPCGSVPVAFDAFGKWPDEPGTRAVTSGSSTSFESGDAIGVTAYWIKDGGFIADTAPNFMYNQKVEYSAGTAVDESSSGTWLYSPVKYWPVSGKVNFYAYYPYAQAGDSRIVLSGNTANGEPTLTYTNSEADIDLMAASSKGLSPSGGSPSAASPAPVTLYFHHLLARVRFRFRNAWEEKQEIYHLGINYLYFKCKTNTVLTYYYGTDKADYGVPVEKAYMPEIINPEEYFEYSDKYTDFISPYYFVPESIKSGELELGIDVFEKRDGKWKKISVHETPTYIAKASLPDKSGLKKGSTVVYDISYKPADGLVITMITEVDGWTEVDNNNEI